MAKVVVRWKKRKDLSPVVVEIKETDLDEIIKEMNQLVKRKNPITPKLWRILQRAKNQGAGGFRNQLKLPSRKRLPIEVKECEFKIREPRDNDFKIHVTL